ncbi:DUF459 domain-containing protein [Aureimonas sp. AU12]|uniref:SGNH/GDSL hydrolase family protein n=1 Tax=Aureimonas sp. AU12 TaxID=1638161 RepID=UPI000A9323F8|nr:DUF459 domain-containing protein [Aureimonas sp. AU12]
MGQRTGRTRFGEGLLSVSLVLALGCAGLVSMPAPAEAQQRRGILDMLFGTPQQARPPAQFQDGAPAPRRVIKKVRKQRKPAQAQSAARPGSASARRAATTAAAGAGAGAAAAVAAAPVEKSATARTILVVGDFMAASLATGLEDAVAESREIRVVGRANGSSGLVRDDHYDWPASIGAAIDEAKPAAVVVMLGSNDRQALRQGSSTLALRTPEWASAYADRVAALADAVKAKGVPLVWVGMPAFQSDRASEDMVYFNDLYRTAALRVGGEFVDVWGGFTDAAGAFAASGPDMAGQTVRLRNSDGITMTPAGQDKLAYFVEKPVTKILGLNVDDLVASLGTQQLSAAELPGVASQAATAVATPPMSFGDPGLDGGETLLGGAAKTATPAGAGSPRDNLVRGGSPVAAAEGRADQFNWTGRGTAVAPATRDNAIVFRGSTTLDELRRAGSAAASADDAAAAAAKAAGALVPAPAGGASTP